MRRTGAWWWIDRWRKSTAYTDMTAEEQGLYRNLLDEVWLREDHLIPDDPRILARVSGDPEAWARCGDKVLRWMVRRDGGWTHETALEVIDQADRRAQKQARYRERSRNAGGNDAGNNRGNQAGSPSPSPSPYSVTVGRQEQPAPPPPPEQRAEEATDATIRRLQLELGAYIARLAEHPNSRQMVPAWSREVTAYTRADGTKVRGVADYRTVHSIDRLEKSIEDAQWWWEEMEAGKVVGGAVVNGAR